MGVWCRSQNIWQESCWPLVDKSGTHRTDCMVIQNINENIKALMLLITFQWLYNMFNNSRHTPVMFFRSWICSSSAAMCFCPWWAWCFWQPCSCCCPYISWSPSMPNPWEHTRPRGSLCQTPTDIPEWGSQPGSVLHQRALLEMRGQQKVPELLSSWPNQRCPHLSERPAQLNMQLLNIFIYSILEMSRCLEPRRSISKS